MPGSPAGALAGAEERPQPRPQLLPVIPARSSPRAAAAPRHEDTGSTGLPASADVSKMFMPLGLSLPGTDSGPRVVIDRLQIDVVPPPAPAPAQPPKKSERTERRAPSRQPASQIGPLSPSTTNRHYLALRYR